MKMTLEQYIQNPMGKNNAVLNSNMREAARASYTDKLNKIMLREHGNVWYRLFKNTKLNKYYIYIKIPSEVVNKFYYDVVVEFYTDSDVKEAGRNLLKYYVKFYSNDPAFTFTYAYVFRRNSLFINELRYKMSNKALNEIPKEKNPNKDVGYVKSLYFAYLLIKLKNLNSLNKFEAECTEIDWNYLGNNIENADSKIAKRQDLGDKLKKIRKLKNPNRKVSVGNSIPTNSLLKVTGVKNTNTKQPIRSKISRIKSVKNTKRK